MGGVDLIYLWG